MSKANFCNMPSTNDRIIRVALIKELNIIHSRDNIIRIFNELAIENGTSRIDIAVVNSLMHGFEIKSDCDTLERLPGQLADYNNVFDKITLIVGKKHLYDAINMIPDWWGVVVAKININNEVIFNRIRDAEINQLQIGPSIARLLWKEEALNILEKYNSSRGVRSKTCELIYERLAGILDMETLKECVRQVLLSSRRDWRSDAPLMRYDGL